MWVKLIPKAYPPKYFLLIGSVVGVHNIIKTPHTYSPGLQIQHCELLSPTPGLGLLMAALKQNDT